MVLTPILSRNEKFSGLGYELRNTFLSMTEPKLIGGMNSVNRGGERWAYRSLRCSASMLSVASRTISLGGTYVAAHQKAAYLEERCSDCPRAARQMHAGIKSHSRVRAERAMAQAGRLLNAHGHSLWRSPCPAGDANHQPDQEMRTELRRPSWPWEESSMKRLRLRAGSKSQSDAEGTCNAGGVRLA